MIELIKELLKSSGIGKKKEIKYDKTSRMNMAVCVLLLEVAYSDDEFSGVEREKVIAILRSYFKLEEKQVEKLIAEAEKVQKENVELWKFTNLVNAEYSNEDKLKLIELMWEVVYADQALDKHEDYIIHKLSDLLHVSHKEFIDAKLKVKKQEV